MNFIPEIFYEDVRQLFHNEIYLLHKEFYQELMNITKQRHLNYDSNDLDRRCHHLFKLLSKHGKFNLDKFEIYLSRNIVDNSTDLANLIVTSNSTKESEELIQKRQHLINLRKKYTKLLNENHQIQAECHEKEQLIDNMNAALFKYRVGIQVLDHHEVTPLDESIAQLQQQSNQLKLLTMQAEELVQEIQQSLDSSSTEYLPDLLSPTNRRVTEGDSNHSFDISNNSPIQTGDSDDIRLLNSAFS